jgi:hypothetical protein
VTRKQLLTCTEADIYVKTAEKLALNVETRRYTAEPGEICCTLGKM